MGKLSRTVLVGTSGKVYVNGELESYIESINVKVTGDFEDLNCCGTFEQDYAYTGCKCEGEMTINKTKTTIDSEILESFTTGAMVERTIVTKLTNPSTGKTESYSISDVIYTELTPVDIKKGVIKQSIPFKCSMPKLLDEIT